MLVLGDGLSLKHSVQDLVAALGGSGLVVIGRIAVGALNSPRQQRRLGQGQIAHILAEIDLRSLAHPLDAEAAALAQVDGVAIALENLFLREAALQLEGHHGFGSLPRHRFVERQEEATGKLLREGAGTLPGASFRDVHIASPYQPQIIKSRVLEEAAILNRQHGGDQVLRQILEAHQSALLAVAIEQVSDELRLEGIFTARELVLERRDAAQLTVSEIQLGRFAGEIGVGAGIDAHPAPHHFVAALGSVLLFTETGGAQPRDDSGNAGGLADGRAGSCVDSDVREYGRRGAPRSCGETART